jgi:hypothetical protein
MLVAVMGTSGSASRCSGVWACKSLILDLLRYGFHSPDYVAASRREGDLMTSSVSGAAISGCKPQFLEPIDQSDHFSSIACDRVATHCWGHLHKLI